MTEGRRSFLQRYAGIESGDECRTWRPVISAMVDGEATAAQVLELRPHLRNCPGCRATLKALQDSSAPIAAVLPVPLVVTVAAGSNALPDVFMRTYEALTGGVHERLVNSMAKAQAVLEAAPAGKVAAVAASAAAVAGGGYATVDQATRASRQPARVAAGAPSAVAGSASSGSHRSVSLTSSAVGASARAAALVASGRERTATRVTREFGLEGGAAGGPSGNPVAVAATIARGAPAARSSQPARKASPPSSSIASASAPPAGSTAVQAEFGP